VLIRDIAQYLEASSIGALGVDIFLDHEPDQPDNCITLYDTGSFAPYSQILDLRRTMQVRVRDASYPAGYDRIWRIFCLMDTPGNRFTVLPNGRKVIFQAMQAPQQIDVDATGRHILVFNLSIMAGRD
jgi:hypothetical protein